MMQAKIATLRLFPRVRPRRWLLASGMLALCGCTPLAAVEIIRGTPPLDRSQLAGISADDFESGHFVASDGRKLDYRLLAPNNIEADKRYPLVVHFHGSGGIGSDNRAQIEKDAAARSWALQAVRERHTAFVLLPQFAERSANYDDPKTPAEAYAGSSLPAALELVDAITAQQPIDASRIYASGFSMGGSTAWLSALQRPRLFAAIVTVGAVAPDGRHAPQLTQLPILVLHGDVDDENPIVSDRELTQAILAHGGRKIRLREYAGLGHQPPGDFIPGHWWRDWLFAQRRAAD